jgi:hypothetical protein
LNRFRIAESPLLVGSLPRRLSLLPAFLLFGLLVPWSLMEVAERVGYEPHVVSFIIGPATYAFGNNLVPGIDYFTQYSVGLPYLFYWLLGSTGDTAVLNYVRLMVGAMFFFYLGLFYHLQWLLRSWLWALATTVTVLLLQFHGDRPFFDPSSYVLRYPLLIVTIWATSVWVRRNYNWSSTAVVAISIGASLFLNTETGLYQALAVTAVGVVCSKGTVRGLLLSVMPALGGVAVLGMLCRLAFGEAVISRQFIDGLTLPFLIYGGGFGGVPIDWQYGWHIFYNIVTPGIVIVTVVLCARKLWRDDLPPQVRAHFAAVMMFCFIALLMSAKYINMSLIALWHVNAIGFLVVLAWWGQQFQHLLRHGPITSKFLRFSSRLFLPGLAAAVIGLLAYSNDPRSPNAYGLRAWSKYPALFNPLSWRVRSGCRRLACSAPRISPLDIDLINRWTPPGQRVAVLGSYDWAYLIQARRPSWFTFLPSSAIFTRQQLAAASNPPNILFLPRSFDKDHLDSVHPELARLWSADLTQFEVLEMAPNLVAWKKR